MNSSPPLPLKPQVGWNAPLKRVRGFAHSANGAFTLFAVLLALGN